MEGDYDDDVLDVNANLEAARAAVALLAAVKPCCGEREVIEHAIHLEVRRACEAIVSEILRVEARMC